MGTGVPKTGIIFISADFFSFLGVNLPYNVSSGLRPLNLIAPIKLSSIIPWVYEHILEPLVYETRFTDHSFSKIILTEIILAGIVNGKCSEYLRSPQYDE